MSQLGKWVANCMPERVARISAASAFQLRVGPPQANQLQDQAELEAMGLVGLYRSTAKSPEQTARDQRAYLADNDFAPSPELLAVFLGPAMSSERQSS